MSYGKLLSESLATNQTCPVQWPTAIIRQALSDLKPRSVPFSHAADILRYNEVVHEKS